MEDTLRGGRGPELIATSCQLCTRALELNCTPAAPGQARLDGSLGAPGRTSANTRQLRRLHRQLTNPASFCRGSISGEAAPPRRRPDSATRWVVSLPYALTQNFAALRPESYVHPERLQLCYQIEACQVSAAQAVMIIRPAGDRLGLDLPSPGDWWVPRHASVWPLAYAGGHQALSNPAFISWARTVGAGCGTVATWLLKSMSRWDYLVEATLEKNPPGQTPLGAASAALLSPYWRDPHAAESGSRRRPGRIPHFCALLPAGCARQPSRRDLGAVGEIFFPLDWR